MKHERQILTEAELLERLPLNSRQLRELRFRKKIPYIVAGHRTLFYDFEAVLRALKKLEIKEAKP